MANRLVAFISNSNGVLYDSRQEDNEQINVNLDALITNAGFLVNDQNQKLMLVFGQHIADFQILKYSDLFTFYLSNKYLSISPTDLIKISTWLNDEWRKYLIGNFERHFYVRKNFIFCFKNFFFLRSTILNSNY